MPTARQSKTCCNGVDSKNYDCRPCRSNETVNNYSPLLYKKHHRRFHRQRRRDKNRELFTQTIKNLYKRVYYCVLRMITNNFIQHLFFRLHLPYYLDFHLFHGPNHRIALFNFDSLEVISTGITLPISLDQLHVLANRRDSKTRRWSRMDQSPDQGWRAILFAPHPIVSQDTLQSEPKRYVGLQNVPGYGFGTGGNGVPDTGAEDPVSGHLVF